MFNREQMIEEIELRIKSLNVRIDESNDIIDDITKNYLSKKLTYLPANKYGLKSTNVTRVKCAKAVISKLEAALKHVNAGADLAQVLLPIQRSDIAGVLFINNRMNEDHYAYDAPYAQPILLDKKDDDTKSRYFFCIRTHGVDENGCTYIKVKTYGYYSKHASAESALNTLTKNPDLRWVIKLQSTKKYYKINL